MIHVSNQLLELLLLQNLLCRITIVTQTVDITSVTRIKTSLTYVHTKLLRPNDITQPVEFKRLKHDMAASVESGNRLLYNAEIKVIKRQTDEG